MVNYLVSEGIIKDAGIKETKSYPVEIIETLKLSVFCEAVSMDEAKYIVMDKYRNGEYILDADHFTNVDFIVKYPV